jgi:thiamine transporter ThiT
LSTASLASLWFWRLLLQLEALCPVCPWNHVLTYVALGFAARLRLKQKQRMSNENSGQLGQLAAVCVLWFLLCLAGWFFFEFSVEKATSAQ